MEGMWHSGESMFAEGDEVVTDGAPQFSRARQQFHPTTELTKGVSSKNTTDSGFLSGVSITSCSGISSSDLLSEEPASTKVSSSNTHTNSPGMKLMDCVSRGSDSGLDLSYSYDPKTNNLSGQQTSSRSKASQAPKAPRRITLHDLLRQDEDGDTPLHLAVLQGFIEVVFSLVRILSDPRFLEIPNKKLRGFDKPSTIGSSVGIRRSQRSPTGPSR